MIENNRINKNVDLKNFSKTKNRNKFLRTCSFLSMLLPSLNVIFFEKKKRFNSRFYLKKLPVIFSAQPIPADADVSASKTARQYEESTTTATSACTATAIINDDDDDDAEENEDEVARFYFFKVHNGIKYGTKSTKSPNFSPLYWDLFCWL